MPKVQVTRADYKKLERRSHTQKQRRAAAAAATTARLGCLKGTFFVVVVEGISREDEKIFHR